MQVAMQVTLGEDGLSKSYQAPFPKTTKCDCGGEARIAFVADEISEDGEYVCVLHRNEPKGDGYWPHDVCCVAVYFCKDCLGAVALMNQA